MSREAVKIVKFSQDTTQSIRTILVKRGWVIWTDDMPVDCWNLRWQTRRYDKADHAALERFQYLNHFPRSSCFTAKDTLAKSMQTMAKQYPEVYDFHPLTFTCPKETEAFKAFYDRLEAQARKENKVTVQVAAMSVRVSVWMADDCWG
jgi:hypothetical protein